MLSNEVTYHDAVNGLNEASALISQALNNKLPEQQVEQLENAIIALSKVHSVIRNALRHSHGSET